MRLNKFAAYIIAAVLTFAAVPPTLLHAAPIPQAAFEDTEGNAHGLAVDYAAGHGYLYLYTDNDMAYPNNPPTRGEWAYTFNHWLRYLQPTLTGMGFAPEKREVVLEDISGSVFYDSVNYLASHGLTERDVYLFRPDDMVTRQEICEYMALLLPELGVGPDYALDTEFILSRYQDRDDFLPWYEWQIAFMSEAGLMGYYEGGDFVFMPDMPYTRGEMCEMLLSAETMIREKARARKADGLGISAEMEIDRISVSNITATGYNVEVTVNDAAKDINPHVIVAYTPEDEGDPSLEDILSGGYYTQSQRLTAMRRVNTDTDETTYSVIMRGRPNTDYNLYVILKDGMEYSNMADYTVRLPEEE